MFRKLLIANRGEIACRIIKTAKRLGVSTVAVYSEADRAAHHLELADEAVLIGPAPAQQSYLNSSAIMRAAKLTAAEAVHPGYGFLSENAEFAEVCAREALTFIGPSVAALRNMGSKHVARRIVRNAGVPVVPGYDGDAQAPHVLQQHAGELGFPLLIKAVAGGGGRGMRRVAAHDEFHSALQSAKREAQAAFRDDRVLLEKYIAQPRHIEVQIFGLASGQVLQLFERDCSVQRRHQKLVEEAPAPGISQTLRQRLGEAAITVAAAIEYTGAGTVEFILAGDGQFYFMEMNTRLQVEHPITELVTGQDLVEWQLLAAAGESLPVTQPALKINGHAIEARLYAEDPARDYAPSAGTISRLRFPAEQLHVRIDAGVREGDQVGVHYDSLLAKVIVWDRNRAAAVQRLQTVLAATQLTGLHSNLALLRAIVSHSAFVTGDYDTGLIDAHREDLLREASVPTTTGVLLAVLYRLLSRVLDAQQMAAHSHDRQSPWNAADSWRLNSAHCETLELEDHNGSYQILVKHLAMGYELVLEGNPAVHARGYFEDHTNTLIAHFDAQRLRADVLSVQDKISVWWQDMHCEFQIPAMVAAESELAVSDASLRSPMPGRIVEVAVAVGQQVVQGQVLMVLEAMKMEHTICAPKRGRITMIRHQPGELIDEGIELLQLESGD